MGGPTRLPPVSSLLCRSVTALLPDDKPGDGPSPALDPVLPFQPAPEVAEPSTELIDLRNLCDRIYGQDAGGLVICHPAAGSQQSAAPSQRGYALLHAVVAFHCLG